MRKGHFPRWPLIAVIAVLVGLAIAAVLVVLQWPFTREKVVKSLREQSGMAVQMANFRHVYFPHPGCVAEGVQFLRSESAGTPPLMTIDKLVVRGSYAGLFIHHIDEIHAVHLRVTIPPEADHSGIASGPIQAGASSGLSIDKIIADGAEVDFASSQPGAAPLVFQTQKLLVSAISDNHPVSFQATVRIPEPPATVNVEGKFGPWKTGTGGQTPISGSYKLDQADLGVFSGIAGTLSGRGSFRGILQHIETEGTTDTPDFSVSRAGNPVHLVTQFHALVDGLNGDVALQQVTAHFGKTTIVSRGTVASTTDGQGKTVSLDMSSSRARIEDLLRLVGTTTPPPMTGAILFDAKTTLPPGPRPFLDKVKLQGDFGISGGQYTNPATQKDVDVASARARGEADKVEDEDDKRGTDSYDPGRVVSNVKGHVVLQNSVAHLNDLSFDVPGASAVLSGTFALKTLRVNLEGEARLDAQLSQATTGVKSFLLKIVQPLLKKKKQQRGAIVHVKVGGTYHNPSFTVTPVVKK